MSANPAAPSARKSPHPSFGFQWFLLLLAATLASPVVEFRNGTAPLFWLPIGIALGALIKGGKTELPGLWCGLLGAHLLIGQSPTSALALASLNILGCQGQVLLLQYQGFNPQLRRRKDGWHFLGTGTLLGGLLIGAEHTLVSQWAGSIFSPMADTCSSSLGILLGTLPILTYAPQKLQNLVWSQALKEWIWTWLLPALILGTSLLLGVMLPATPMLFIPVLGLLWMFWFIQERGPGCSAIAILLTALILGWSLRHPWFSPLARHVEALWVFLMSISGLAISLTPLLAEMRSSDRQMKLALEGSRTGIWDWNIGADRISFSSGWLQSLGLNIPPGGLPQRDWEKLLHPDDLHDYREAMHRHQQGETPLFREQFRIQLQPDDHRWMIARGRIVERDPQGNPLRVVGTLVDISKQKATQVWLRLLERALQSAWDAVAIVALRSPGHPLIFVNDAFQNMTGYGAADARGRMIPFLAGPPGESAALLVQEALDSGEPTQGLVRILRRDGSGFWSKLSISPVRDGHGEISHYIAIFSDVSADVEAQERLRERDELLQKLSQQVPGLIFQYLLPVNGHSCFPYTSDGLTPLFNLLPEQVRNDASPFFARLHPEDRTRVRACLHGELQALKPWEDKFRVVIDDREYWREGNAFPEIQADGDILWHGYIKDTSEQVRLVMALGESEARFRTTANAAPMLIWVADADGHCHWYNQAWSDFTGCDTMVELGSSWVDHVHPEDQDPCRSLVANCLRYRTPFRLECRLRHRDGHWHWVINQGVPRRDENSNFIGYIGACVDIDDQKRVELALRHSREQLRQISLREEEVLEQERKRIASQVHDELGQLLTALKMGIAALRLRYAEVPGLTEQVQSLNELSARAFRVVRQVTTHLRPQALNHGLRPALEWLARETTQSTGLQVLADCPEMGCQPPEPISNTLFRLAQEGITNILKHAQAQRAEIILSCTGEYLILLVRDNGIGFCLGAPDMNHGYGLLGMRERAQTLGGQFHIDSIPGTGTTLSLAIPVECTHDCNSCHCYR